MQKKIFSALTILLSAGFIMSCSTEPAKSNYNHSPAADSNLVASPTAVVYAPSSVTICDMDTTPNQPLEEITTIQVDLYNEYGIKRQQAQINQMLKEQAYSVGGNAVIIINNPDQKHCYAKVVQTTAAATTPPKNVIPSTSTSATIPVLATKSQSQL